jgi:DNA-binding response OmpR family regulator
MENSIQNSRILIVDDDPSNIRLLEDMLSTQGYTISTATNGAEALQSLEKQKVDLILLDIIMPDMDGYNVCIEIKNNAELRDIPIIFVTAKTETEDLVRGFEAGAVDYVIRPYKRAELLARVKTHLELKKARDEIHTLRGILPICSRCKKIRDDEGYWKKLEEYIERHSTIKFSHSLCKDCAEELYGKQKWYKKKE